MAHESAFPMPRADRSWRQAIGRWRIRDGFHLITLLQLDRSRLTRRLRSDEVRGVASHCVVSEDAP